jgi:hypothetical protein
MTDEQNFLKNVATHEMTIIRDDGLNRHVRFKKPNSSDMFFDLITWPGSLCFTGHMGTYVFRRLEDMFEFFRMSERNLDKNREGGLSINRSYWGEKLDAIDTRGGYKKYDPAKFTFVVRAKCAEWLMKCPKPERRELLEAVHSDVLIYADDGEDRARRAVVDFEHKTPTRKFQFEDFHEHDLTDYTHRYTWCCYALAWGVAQYDKAKQDVKPSDAIPFGDEQLQDLTALQKFASRAFDNFPSDMESDDLQNHGIAAGLLERKTVMTPCSENCACVESVGSGEETICYRFTDALKRAVALNKT